MKKAVSILVLVIAVMLFAYTDTCNAVIYNFTDLGVLPSYSDSSAVAINSNGQIAGFASEYPGGPKRAVRFVSSGSNVDLGTLSGDNSEATGNNNNGDIVGIAQDSSGNYRATLFDSSGNGNNQDLSTLAGYDWSFGESINNDGKIVGAAYDSSSGATEAILFNQSGNSYTIVSLGTLLGHNYSMASSINISGQIVGKSMPDWGQQRATLFDSTGGGNNIDLGTLGGNYSQAKCINDSGKIVGQAQDGTSEWGGWRATLFDETGNGSNIDLGTLGGDESGAYWINSLGQIVGQAYDNSDNWRATLFDSTGNGNNIDLNTLADVPTGWTLVQASGINDNGWIVGFAEDSSGTRHAYLLTPEPATVFLLGLGGLFLRKRRK